LLKAIICDFLVAVCENSSSTLIVMGFTSWCWDWGQWSGRGRGGSLLFLL